ncbi:hypothetical protein EMCRGX_G017510 [Ephydatia muelleri]
MDLRNPGIVLRKSWIPDVLCLPAKKKDCSDTTVLSHVRRVAYAEDFYDILRRVHCQERGHVDYKTSLAERNQAPLAIAMEGDHALAIAMEGGHALAIAMEGGHALAIAMEGGHALAIAMERGHALAIAMEGGHALAIAMEGGHALAIAMEGGHALAIAMEGGHALAIAMEGGHALAIAMEGGHALAIAMEGGHAKMKQSIFIPGGSPSNSTNGEGKDEAEGSPSYGTNREYCSCKK